MVLCATGSTAALRMLHWLYEMPTFLSLFFSLFLHASMHHHFVSTTFFFPFFCRFPCHVLFKAAAADNAGRLRCLAGHAPGIHAR